MTSNKQTLYACTTKDDYRVTKYTSDETSSEWERAFDMPRAFNDDVEYLLQLKLDREEEMLLATCANGFVVWFLESKSDAYVLMLPNGVRNISTKMMCSNSIMVSGTKNYAVAGVRWVIWRIKRKEKEQRNGVKVAFSVGRTYTFGNWKQPSW